MHRSQRLNIYLKVEAKNNGHISRCQKMAKIESYIYIFAHRNKLQQTNKSKVRLDTDYIYSAGGGGGASLWHDFRAHEGKWLNHIKILA